MQQSKATAMPSMDRSRRRETAETADKDITMKDTHLGWQEKTSRKELLISEANMTDEEWNDFCNQRHRKIEERKQPGGILN